MKKAFLFLLLVTSLSGFAQIVIPQEYTIKNPLLLQTVNPGTASDSVLVRGTDKIIKYVPRSEFVSSSPLQSVLEFGNFAEFDGGNSSVNILSGDENEREFSAYTSNGTTSGYLFTDNNTAGIGSDNGSTAYSDVRSNNGHIELRESSGDYETKVKFQTPTSESNLFFPAKLTGDYTLATLDDIPVFETPNMQQVYEAGRTITGDNVVIFNTSDGQNALYYNPSSLKFNNIGSGEYLQMSDYGFGWGRESTSSYVGLDLRRTSFGLASFTFPEKPEGNYTLATLEDIGGSDLQSVLDSGNTSTSSLILQNFTDDNNFEKNTQATGYAVYQKKEDGFSKTSTLTPSYLVFQDEAGERNSGMNAGVISIASTPSGVANELQIYPDQFIRNLPDSSVLHFMFPEKSTGYYTLALDSDLTLDRVLSGGSISGGSITLKNFSETAQTIVNNSFIEQIDNGETTKIVGNRLYGNSDSYNNVNMLDLKRQTAGNGAYYFAERATGSYGVATIGNTAPSSATDTGVVGEIRVAGDYIYWCVATNTWLRAEGTTF